MSVRPLTLLSVKPCTAAMLTILNDGQWHPRAEVRQRGHLSCLAEERDATLSWAARILARRAQDGPRTEQDRLDLGAKGMTYNRLDILARRGRVEVDGDQVRMTVTALAQWREATGYTRTDTPPAPGPAGATATPAGLPQADELPGHDETPDPEEGPRVSCGPMPIGSGGCVLPLCRNQLDRLAASCESGPCLKAGDGKRALEGDRRLGRVE